MKCDCPRDHGHSPGSCRGQSFKLGQSIMPEFKDGIYLCHPCLMMIFREDRSRSRERIMLADLSGFIARMTVDHHRCLQKVRDDPFLELYLYQQYVHAIEEAIVACMIERKHD